jgi:hypothetical protein
VLGVIETAEMGTPGCSTDKIDTGKSGKIFNVGTLHQLLGVASIEARK